MLHAQRVRVRERGDLSVAGIDDVIGAEVLARVACAQLHRRHRSRAARSPVGASPGSRQPLAVE